VPVKETIRLYLRTLEESNYSSLIELFTHDAVVDSPLYGKKRASEFYKELFKDTNSSKITLLDIFESENAGAGYFRYDWKLKDGTLVTFDCVDVFRFLQDKIETIKIIYDTYYTRAAFKKLSDLGYS